MIRSLVACILALGLLVAVAGAKQPKPHPAGKQPKPPKYSKVIKRKKFKPHKAG